MSNLSKREGVSSRTRLEGDLLFSTIKEIDSLRDSFEGDQEASALINLIEFWAKRDVLISDFADFVRDLLLPETSTALLDAVAASKLRLKNHLSNALRTQREREISRGNWNTASFHYPDLGSGVTGGTNTPHIARINFENKTGESVDVGFYKRNKLFHKKEIILRLHSACNLSEILWHCDCECCQQLQWTKDLIEETGQGIVIYLWQEGRGAGLAKKMEALSLTQGSESLTADEALETVAGSRDLRSYKFVPRVFGNLGIDKTTKIKLVTDNMEKYQALVDAGFNVELISAVGKAPNLQAALEIAEKALSGKYKVSVLLNSKSLDWINCEVQKVIDKKPVSGLFLNWLERVQKNESVLDSVTPLKEALRPVLSLN